MPTAILHVLPAPSRKRCAAEPQAALSLRKRRKLDDRYAEGKFCSCGGGCDIYEMEDGSLAMQCCNDECGILTVLQGHEDD